MKKALFSLIASIVVTVNGFSQTVYLADTAFTTDNGYGGAPASCNFKPGGYDFGWKMAYNENFRVADFFTVPTGNNWVFDTVVLFGYQVGSSTLSTFNGAFLQIYSGTPGIGGSAVWGDSTVSILASTGFTGIYRVDTSASTGGLTDTARPIMYLKLYLSPAPNLSPGTYWLVWSATGTDTGTISSPEKVLPGRINPSGQNARQEHNGTWNTIIDDSHTIGLNMLIKASADVSVKNITNSTSPTLSQNTPNPFSESTNISFYLPQDGYTKLCVYNAIGQLVNTLIDANLNSGKYQVTFNPQNLPDGIYYYKLTTTTGTESGQMQLLH